MKPMRSDWWRPLALAITLGTAVGLVHVLVTLVRYHIRNEFTWTSRDVLWMSPVGNVALLVVPALVLACVTAAWRRPAIWQFSVGILGSFAALSAILNIRGLHSLAAVALSVGLGTALSRWWRQPRGIGWSAAGSALAIAALAAVAQLRRDTTSRVAPAAAGSPNVLVLILDTVRAASMSLHGYGRPTTPGLERFAREGAVFDFAISPSAWTLPSHASMFTGRRSSTLGVSWRRPLDATYPTVAELFRETGYATGAFVGNPFYTHHESGIDRGFDVLRDFDRSPSQVFWSTTLGQTPFANRIVWERTPRAALSALRELDLRVASEPQSDRRRAAEILEEFHAWRAAQDGRPWFAFLNLYDAHDPYDPPRAYRQKFAATPSKQDLYDAGIAYMDDELQRTFQELRASGTLDNTIIVITSDHGEQWGEHGLQNHGNSLFMPVLHVPLIIRFPSRVGAGTRVRQPVSLTDLAATLIDAAGMRRNALPGTSLLSACCDSVGHYEALVVAETEQLDPSTRQKAPAHFGALSSIVSDSLQYIVRGDSTYQLFDLRNDFRQERDLLQSLESYPVAMRLDSLLRSASQVPVTPPLTVEYLRRAHLSGKTMPVTLRLPERR